MRIYKLAIYDTTNNIRNLILYDLNNSFVCLVTYETLDNYIRNQCETYTNLTLSTYENTIAKTEKI